MSQRGRKAKHHVTNAGETITGLIKQKDGRWRILATGERFTAESEAEAIARFRQKIKPDNIAVPSTLAAETHTRADGHDELYTRAVNRGPDFWPWLREFLIANQQEVADKTGLRGLASVDLTRGSQNALAIADIVETYKTRSESTQNTRGHVESAVRRLTEITGASTIDQLTTQALSRFRDQIVGDLRPTGAAAIFGKLKAGLSFARKVGMDAGQVDAVLSRMKVLYAPRADSHPTPSPISKEEFSAMLAVADARWRATLLLALNGALYLADIRLLEWADFDLDARVYSARRNKTKIVRVMALWDETVEALKALPRTGSPLVFPSNRGAAYRSDSLHRPFADFRETAKINGQPVTATFSSIRDGAYTAAASSVDDRTARIFAAHASQGLMDAYVARNPELVRPAAEAVKAAYGPFPTAA
jgi:integrase